MLTPEQYAFGEEKYEALKVVMNNVDDKYSMSYHEPVLDLPSSLNLTPLTFTPLTDLQLQELAETHVNAWYASENEKIRKWYVDKVSANGKQMQNALKKYNKQANEYNSRMVSETAKAKVKVRNNGMASSTVYANVLTKISDDYDTLIESAETDYNNTVVNLQAELSDLSEQLELRQDALDSGRPFKMSCDGRRISFSITNRYGSAHKCMITLTLPEAGTYIVKADGKEIGIVEVSGPGQSATIRFSLKKGRTRIRTCRSI